MVYLIINHKKRIEGIEMRKLFVLSIILITLCACSDNEQQNIESKGKPSSETTHTNSSSIIEEATAKSSSISEANHVDVLKPDIIDAGKSASTEISIRHVLDGSAYDIYVQNNILNNYVTFKKDNKLSIYNLITDVEYDTDFIQSEHKVVWIEDNICYTYSLSPSDGSINFTELDLNTKEVWTNTLDYEGQLYDVESVVYCKGYYLFLTITSDGKSGIGIVDSSSQLKIYELDPFMLDSSFLKRVDDHSFQVILDGQMTHMISVVGNEVTIKDSAENLLKSTPIEIVTISDNISIIFEDQILWINQDDNMLPISDDDLNIVTFEILERTKDLYVVVLHYGEKLEVLEIEIATH